MRRFFNLISLLILAMSPVAQADVILWNEEQITINSSQGNVTLFDASCANIVSGGEVFYLYSCNSSMVNVSGGHIHYNCIAHNSSNVHMSGGSASGYLYAYDSSMVDVSGGSISGDLRSYGSSTVDVSGGTILGFLSARDYSTIDMSGGKVGGEFRIFNNSIANISGGTISMNLIAYDYSKLHISGGLLGDNLYAYSSSIVIFNLKDFRLGAGLSMDGERLLGTGILSGEWMDDTTRWSINIVDNSGAGIFVSRVGNGDANCDGSVDADDAAILASNWHNLTNAIWRQGDFNGDGAVNDIDATIFATNWQHNTSDATAPESSTLINMLGIVGFSFILYRRR